MTINYINNIYAIFICISLTNICNCVHIHVWMCSHASVHMEAGANHEVSTSKPPPCCFKWSLSLHLELDWLASNLQRPLVTAFPALSSQYHTHRFHTGAWDWTPLLILAGQVLYWRSHLLTHLFTKSFHLRIYYQPRGVGK